MSSGDTEMIRRLREQLCSVENERDDFSREVENLTFRLDELAGGAGKKPNASPQTPLDTSPFLSLHLTKSYASHSRA